MHLSSIDLWYQQPRCSTALQAVRGATMKATTKTRAKAKSLTRVGDPECHVARRTSHGEKLVGHGAAAIQTVRETRPDVYVKVVASLLPRQVQAEVSGPSHEDRVTALAERLARLDQERAEQNRSRE